MKRYRFYYNGKLSKSTEVTPERGQKWLDNSQADWSKNLMPQVAKGEFDPNNGSEVTRVSPTELLVTTTGGHKLRWVIL
jgi:hypothetical protein